MTHRDGASTFRGYAAFYDLFYQAKDYRKESAYVLRLLRSWLEREPDSILDLGCGTGGHALEWARRGITVTGVDRSHAMLRRAEAKARRQRRTVRFVAEDIRRLDLGIRFDAATAMFGVISYQTTRRDLMATLRSVRRHLPDGGVFVFDAWFGPGVRALRPEDRVKRFERHGSEIVKTAVAAHREHRRLVEVRYDILAITAARVVERVREVHTMRYLFPREVRDLASHTGFRLVDCHPFLSTGRAPTRRDWNATFVLVAVAGRGALRRAAPRAEFACRGPATGRESLRFER